MDKYTIDLIRELLAEAVRGRKARVMSRIGTCNPETIDANDAFKRELIEYRRANAAFEDFVDEYEEDPEE